MDEVDRANNEGQAYIDERIRQAQRAAATRLKPMMRCYYCNSELNSHMLFCDSECREDYEIEQKARRRNGT